MCSVWNFAFFLLLVAFVSIPCSAGPPKKFIEWSAVEPDVNFLLSHPDEINQLPFDGFVFRMTSATGEQMMWDMWGQRTWQDAEFEHAVQIMNRIEFGHLKIRFLRVNVTPGNVDWLDDRAFAVVVENFRLAAKLARRMGFTGLLFDNEQYVTRLFDAGEMRKASGVSDQCLQCIVRQRGCEWIRAINAEFPDLVILMTFGYRAAKASDDPNFRVGNYALLAPFLDGVLAGADPRTRLVDGWEYSYGYKERLQFEAARDVIKTRSLEWTACPDKYKLQFQAAMAVWTDYELKGTEWSQDNFSKNFHTPEQFQTCLRFAAGVSDEYVWVYSGRPNWWTGHALPSQYIDALKHVRAE